MRTKLDNNKEINNNEKWESIEGTSDYIVSSFGRVMSLKGIKPRILKPSCRKSGEYQYEGVILCIGGKKVFNTIHKLVATAFLDYNPAKNMVISHIDGNRFNNNHTNLEIITKRWSCSKDIDKTQTSSRYIGVSYVKKMDLWGANILINRVNHNLGFFRKEIDARIAYLTKLSSIEE